MADGNVVIDVTLDTEKAESSASKLGSDLDSKVGGGASRVAGKIAKIGTVAVTAGATAVGALTKSAVSSYASYEQLVGGVDTLFKKSSQQVQKYADEAYKTAGMSANEYMETATSFSASLLQGLKGDTKKASEEANKAIIDMSDNANKMGTSMEMIQNAYQGFAKQNYTMLDNLKLGYGGTASEMARLVKDSGVLGDAGKDLTAKNLNEKVSFDQIVDAIHKVQGNMGITGTTAKEASSTIEGSVNTMKGAWTNLMTAMGDNSQDTSAKVKQFTDSVGTVLKNVLPIVQEALSGIGDVITQVAPMIAEKLPALLGELIPKLITAGIGIIQALVQGITSALPSLLEQLPTLLNQVVEALVGLLPTLLTSIIAGVSQLVTSLAEALPTLITTLITGITSAIDQLIPTLLNQLPVIMDALINGLVNGISALYGALPQFIQVGVKLLLALVDGILSAIPTLIQMLPQIIQSMITYLLQALPMIINGIIQLVNMIVEQIPVIIEALVTALPSIISMVVDALIQALPQIIQGIISLVNAIVDNLPIIITSLISALPTIITSIINGLLKALPTLITGLIQLVLGIVQAIPRIIVALIKSLPTIIKMIIQGLIKALPQLIKGLITFVIEIVKNLPKIIMGLIKAIPTIIIEIVKALIEAVPELIKGIVQMVTMVVKNLPKILVKLWEFIKSIPGRIWNLIKAIAGFGLKLGQDMIKGLWNGIKNMGKWIWNKIKGFFGGIVDGIKDFFGIKSPSRLMRDEVGKFIAQGIWVGFKDENPMEQINDAVANGYHQLETNARMQSMINYGSMVDAFSDAGLVVKFKEREVGRMVREYA